MAIGEILLHVSTVAALAAGVEPRAAAQIPLWQGVTTVNVQCQVATDRGMEDGPIRARLCDTVRAVAARNAPVPVRLSEIGDRATLRHDAVTLLTHASISTTPAGPVLAFYVRPYRNGEQAAALLFGAMPRTVMLRPRGGDATALEAAVAATLRETLPWQAGGGARRIPQ